MIPDQLLRLADGQSIATGATVRTSAIDIDTLRDVGMGTTLYVRIRIDTAYTQASGGANINVGYADNDTASNFVTLSQFPLSSGGSVPAAGTVLYIPIPPTSKDRLGTLPNNTKKYFLVQFATYTAATVGGTWTVDIVTEVNMAEHTYQKGFAVE